MKAENCGASTVYERLARGEYEAVKDGSKTLITVESIKRRRQAKLRPWSDSDRLRGHDLVAKRRAKRQRRTA
jgi:hypothetical protein